jgi:RNA polymerase sigma-70 factor (sigma-E family)
MRDEASYVEFVSARWTSLYRFAYLMAGSEHAAEDLLQTSLMKAFVSWDKVQHTESPEAYVRRIVVNTAISDGRSRSRRPEVIVELIPESPTAATDVASIDRAALWPLVAALPARQRAVVVLRYYEDLSEAEIARILGCARGTVKSQASAALRSLRVTVAPMPTGDRT